MHIRKTTKIITLANRQANAKKLISVKSDDYSISWGYNGSNAIRKAFTTAKCVNAEHSEDMLYNSVENSCQKVQFSNIESNCDLEYVINGKDIKENIVIKSKKDKYSFAFDIQVKNLFLNLEDDNTVSCKNSDGDTIFTIPAPYMYDAENNSSDNVKYSLLHKNNNKYTLTVEADDQWINDENRVFPVVVDPQLVTEQKSYMLRSHIPMMIRVIL